MPKKNLLGFTIVELMVVIAVLAIIGGISFSGYQLLAKKSELSAATNSTIEALRRAQLLAQAMKEDSQWSVKIQKPYITVYKGTDYASRETAFDELFNLANTITISGTTDYHFSKNTGLPVTTGTTILSNDNGTNNIILNEKGQVNF